VVASDAGGRAPGAATNDWCSGGRAPGAVARPPRDNNRTTASASAAGAARAAAAPQFASLGSAGVRRTFACSVVAVVDRPHSEQNFDPSGSFVAHALQRSVVDRPHSKQNFDPSGSFVAHALQRSGSMSSRPPVSCCCGGGGAARPFPLACAAADAVATALLLLLLLPSPPLLLLLLLLLLPPPPLLLLLLLLWSGDDVSARAPVSALASPSASPASMRTPPTVLAVAAAWRSSAFFASRSFDVFDLPFLKKGIGDLRRKYIVAHCECV